MLISIIVIMVGMIIGALIGLRVEKSNYTPIGSEKKLDAETIKKENEELSKAVSEFNETKDWCITMDKEKFEEKYREFQRKLIELDKDSGERRKRRNEIETMIYLIICIVASIVLFLLKIFN